MAQFKIYVAEVTQLGPVGVLITSAFTNACGYPRAESFLLIPDQKTIISQKLRFDVTSFKDSPVELTEGFMLEEASQQGKIDLGLYLQERQDADGYSPPPNSPNVLEDNINLLVHVWVRRTCPHLVEVYKRTECEQLKDAMSPILKLPIMEREKL